MRPASAFAVHLKFRSNEAACFYLLTSPTKAPDSAEGGQPARWDRAAQLCEEAGNVAGRGQGSAARSALALGSRRSSQGCTDVRLRWGPGCACDSSEFIFNHPLNTCHVQGLTNDHVTTVASLADA